MSKLKKIEVDIIKKMLAEELLVIKKYKLYSTQADDPQLKIKFEQISARHKRHFIDMLNQLK